MKHLLSILLTAILCATASAQTIRTLGYNSTNGQVVANTGTNVLTFGDVTFNSANLSYINWNTNNIFIFDEDPKKIYGDWEMQNGALSFLNSTNAEQTRTNLGLGWSALTNTSNVTMMRALSGSTNTNEPYSGSISVVGTSNTNTLVFSNGILQSVQ